MGADHYIYLPRLYSSQSLSAFRSFHTTSQEGQIQFRKELSQAIQMLLSQDFCRNHQSRLVTCRIGGIHGQTSHNGLTTTNISLQKTVHMGRRLQITKNFSQTPLLSFRQKKWQCCLLLSQHFFRPRDSESLADILGLMLQNLQLHLKIKKFFKLDSTQGLLIFRQIPRKVHGTHSLSAPQKLVALQKDRRKIFL